jgi:methyl-accepting chemotaxis protein
LLAADAATNTTDLLEGTVRKVKEGSGLVRLTNEELERVAAIVARSGEIIGEITAASSEQANGIELINRALTEMDMVTQKNASSAEDSASDSEEMSGQTNRMREFVETLVALVGADGNGESKQRRSRSVGNFPMKMDDLLY